MKLSTLISRAGAEPLPVAGERYLPPPALIGLFVKARRDFKCLKRSALASLAGVSLSTVERIERGEYVSPDLLDMVSVALDLPDGVFTIPTIALDPQEALQLLSADLRHTAVLKVAPLASQAHLRTLANSSGYAVLSSEDSLDMAQEANDLLDRFDTFSGTITTDSKTMGVRRSAYEDLIRHATGMQERGFVVLGGVLKSDDVTTDEPNLVAVFAITRRVDDPGGPKRRVLVVDRRQLHKVTGATDA